MRWVGIAVLLSGCGRIGFDPFGSANGDGGTVGDGGSDARDATVVPCLGTTHLLVDNFDDGAFDAAVWGMSFFGGGTTYQETGGRLVITVPGGSTMYAGYETTNMYNLVEDRMFVEAVSMPAQGSAIAMLQLFFTTGTSKGLAIEFERMDLVVRERDIGGAGLTELARKPYSAVADHWWQVRGKSGDVIFETSADGVTWVEMFRFVPKMTFNLGTTYVNLSAGDNLLGTSTTAVFDNLNGGGQPPSCL